MKTLWVVSGGAEAVPGIVRAKEMGLHVVVSDGNPQAPGFGVADAAVVASTYNGDQTASMARAFEATRHIDGVIAMCADVPLTVATVAEALSLPGLPISIARMAANKLLQKEALVAAGVPTAWGVPVDSYHHFSELARSGKAQRYVLKPTDSRGARGVVQVTSTTDLRAAWAVAVAASPTGSVLFEAWLDGPQFSTEGFLPPRGPCALPGFLDRNYARLEEFAPHIIEDGATQPTLLTPEQRLEVETLHFKAAKALGFYGFSKGDLVLTKDGPAVVEMAARLSGGWMSTLQVPLATGVDLVGAAIRYALGEEVDTVALQPKPLAAVAQRFFFPKPGKVLAVDLPKVRPEGLKKLVLPQVGAVVRPTVSHPSRAGFVIMVGATRAEAVERAEAVVRMIGIETV